MSCARVCTAPRPAAAVPPRRPIGLLVTALAAASLLQWTGSSAVLPLLPIYLSHRGESAALIGAVVAAFFAGGFAAQYAGGHLADRIGHRPVLVLGLLGYAVASAGFVLDVGGAGYAVLRAAQGAAAGVAEVASLALVARCVPRRQRGRAFAVVYGAQLTGMATGPLLGSLVGIAGMGTLFLVAAVGALLAAAPVAAIRPALVDGDPADGDGGRLRWRGRSGRLLVGVLVASAFGGLMTGVYEACWSLLLDARGATSWQISASWTMFAVPFVVASPLAGWLADHRDRRALVIAASISSLVFCVAYGVVPSPAWLVGLGAFDALGVAVAMPAAQSLLADAAPPGAAGRAQGLFASVNTAVVAVAALAGGALFAVAAWLPFAVGGVLGAALVAVLPLAWRGTAGRIRPNHDHVSARHS